MIEQLAASETSPEQSPIDKALEEIVEKTDELEKTCEKLITLIKKSTILGKQLNKMCD